MSYEKLKPCPFYRGRARNGKGVSGKIADDHYIQEHWIYCAICGASTKKSISRIDVVRAWNKREG